MPTTEVNLHLQAGETVEVDRSRSRTGRTAWITIGEDFTLFGSDAQLDALTDRLAELRRKKEKA